MKKLRKLELKAVELRDEEMKVLFGGKKVYCCTRIQKNYDEDGGFIGYTFSTDSESLADSWCAFWESAGWFVTMDCFDDGNDYTPYYYV